MLRLNVSSGRVLEQLELPVPLTGVPATLADFRTWENIPGLLKSGSTLPSVQVSGRGVSTEPGRCASNCHPCKAGQYGLL